MTSFSVRAHIQTEEREYASFLYGWFPDGMDIYLKQLPLNEEESMAFRQELLGFGIFKEAGIWTLQTTIDDQNKATARESYEFALRKVRACLKNRRTVEAASRS